MPHALSILFFASSLAAAAMLIVGTLLREQAGVLAALRMTPQQAIRPQSRVTRVRYAAGPRPVRATAAALRAAA